MIKTICIAGAGTMGTWIAMVAVQGGFDTLLYDARETILSKSATTIRQNISSRVEKQKNSAEEGEAILKRIQFISDASKCIADFFIAPIVKKADAKIVLFNYFAALNIAATIFTTNTSSLLVSLIPADVSYPGWVAAMHFFKPAPIMKPVKVAKGKQTNDSMINAVFKVCEATEKTGALPGFPGVIVNRIARAHYLEAMKIVEPGIATVENVNALMQFGGFKIGEFKLMSLIGIDISLAVSEVFTILSIMRKDLPLRRCGNQWLPKESLGKRHAGDSIITGPQKLNAWQHYSNKIILIANGPSSRK